MRKTLTIAMIAAFVLVCGASLVFAAQQPPAKVTIDAAAKKQPGVVFDHTKHTTLAKSCEQCHHSNKGLTEANAKDVQKCSACHLNPKDAKVPNMAEMSMTKNPFHTLCIGCHKTGVSGKKGPAVCKDCHKK